MKLIPLTQGQFAIVDDEDFEPLSQFTWCVNNSKSTHYAHTQMKTKEGRVNTQMHRFVMRASPTQTIDHRNGDGLDNRKRNLRFATQSQNCMNRKSRVGSSAFKGVHRHTHNRKWMAQICLPGTGRSTHLGSFHSEIVAALCYDKAARKYFGEFVRLNFPEKGEQSCG